MYVGPLGSMWQFWGSSGLSSKNSLFYSVLRRPAMSKMTYHKPTKCLFCSIYSWILQKSLEIEYFRSMNSTSHYVFCDFSGSQNCHIVPEGATRISIYTYTYMCVLLGRAQFSQQTHWIEIGLPLKVRLEPTLKTVTLRVSKKNAALGDAALVLSSKI